MLSIVFFFQFKTFQECFHKMYFARTIKIPDFHVNIRSNRWCMNNHIDISVSIESCVKCQAMVNSNDFNRAFFSWIYNFRYDEGKNAFFIRKKKRSFSTIFWRFWRIESVIWWILPCKEVDLIQSMYKSSPRLSQLSRFDLNL